MKINYFLKIFILFISSLTYNSSFIISINVNKHYSLIAANILNVNTYLKKSYPEFIFKSINYYNNNRSVCYTFDRKNKVKYLLKDKYNYLISFDVYKYKYLITVKSTPISHNNTNLDIDIRHNRNINYNFTNYNFTRFNLKHYQRINNIIYSYIYKNIIINSNKKEMLSIPLFKFFNSY